MKFKDLSIIATQSLLLLMLSSAALSKTTVTIGTVNNQDMIRMKELSPEFERQNPDIQLEWVELEENILRQRLTIDIAVKSGRFDLMTIGMYEVPIWSGNLWLEPMNNLPNNYDVADIFESLRGGLSSKGTLYALPFYGESSMTMYRQDLFEKAGLSMPENPTWDFMYNAASKIHDPSNNIYGACLRGKAGWGENMAFLTTLSNSFGARWFDMQWNPQFDSAEWKNALTFYVDLLTKYGPPNASKNGFNENLALMNSGKCGFWIDATVAGSFITNKNESQVWNKVGFAPAPYKTTQKGSGWLWAWSLAVPASSDAKGAAKKFATWATSKEYSKLVARKYGISAIPPGTRKSTYANPQYMAQAPFAEMTLAQMSKANPQDSTLQKTPYSGIQFVAIPKFDTFATFVGQQFSDALANKITINKALNEAQKIVRQEMIREGYIRE